MESVQSQRAADQWFAIHVCAGREFLSAKHLESRGYEVFLPCYREYRRWSDRVKKVERALFAGYLFSRVHADVVGKIVTTPGVVRIVGDGRGPLPVATEEVEAIRRVVDTRLLVEPWPFLHAGQRVRVEFGPLRGLEGVIVETRNQHRLVVSVSLLQRSVAVEIARDCVSVPHAALMADAVGL
jgi:transcription antitermination factor NusG